MMARIFKKQVRHHVEVYVDDLLVKRKMADQHTRLLAQVFTTLQQYNIKLNSAKCTFAITNENFLGYLVTIRRTKQAVSVVLFRNAAHSEKIVYYMSKSL